jgi:hypothetical protein
MLINRSVDKGIAKQNQIPASPPTLETRKHNTKQTKTCSTMQITLLKIEKKKINKLEKEKNIYSPAFQSYIHHQRCVPMTWVLRFYRRD